MQQNKAHIINFTNCAKLPSQIMDSVNHANHLQIDISLSDFCA